MLGIFLLVSCAPLPSAKAETPSQAQASELAVPDPNPKTVSIVTVIQCRQLVSMLMIDERGGVHSVDLTGMTPTQSLILAQQVPAEHVFAVSVSCASPSDAVI